MSNTQQLRQNQIRNMMIANIAIQEQQPPQENLAQALAELAAITATQELEEQKHALEYQQALAELAANTATRIGISTSTCRTWAIVML
jgi:protein involved in temperature-dependent protein secretion